MPRQAFEMSKSVALGEIFRRSWTTEAVAGSRKSRETEQPIVEWTQASLDLGRGDHMLGQLVPDGFDADVGVAHGWLVRGYGREA